MEAMGDSRRVGLLVRTLALLLCALVVSCIDGHEEYWLERDGSGRAELVYDVPAAMASAMGGVEGVRETLDRFVRETPTLYDATREVSRSGDRLKVVLKARFHSVEDLIKAVSGDSALGSADGTSPLDPLIGDFDVKQEGLKVFFRRTVRPGRALPGASLLMADRLKGRKLEYVLHLPVPAKRSNASRLEDGGRMLVWECPLDSGKLRPLPLEFEAEMPLPLAWIAGGAGGAALAVAVVALGVRRLRRNGAAAPPDRRVT